MKNTDELKTHAAAMSKGIQNELNNDTGVQVTTSHISESTLATIIGHWGNVAKKAARSMTEKYGLPNEASESRLIWYNIGPWKRTVVYRDEIPHNFPAPHVDVLEQVIDYKVPVQKAGDLAAFDGSVIIDRTRGEVAARCDLEAANILSLNLMHDIVSGKLTSEQAREKYAESMSAYLMDRPAPYAEALQFALPTEDTRDIDKTNIGGAMLEQFGEKIKDKFR